MHAITNLGRPAVILVLHLLAFAVTGFGAEGSLTNLAELQSESDLVVLAEYVPRSLSKAARLPKLVVPSGYERSHAAAASAFKVKVEFKGTCSDLVVVQHLKIRDDFDGGFGNGPNIVEFRQRNVELRIDQSGSASVKPIYLLFLKKTPDPRVYKLTGGNFDMDDSVKIVFDSF